MQLDLLPPELFERMPGDFLGNPRVSYYDEFVRIMQRERTNESYIEWSRLAYTVMCEVAGHA